MHTFLQHIVICDLQEDASALKALRSKCNSSILTYIPIDITKRQTIVEAFKVAASKFDSAIDVVVNGCGFMNDRHIDLTIDINLVSCCNLISLASFLCHTCLLVLAFYLKPFYSGLLQTGVIHSTLIALEYMDKSKGGQGGMIVNISSVIGVQPNGMFAIYSAAKSGLIAFTRALAVSKTKTYFCFFFLLFFLNKNFHFP